MNIGGIIKLARKVAADNSPAILTAIGVTGTVMTAILAAKAGFKAKEVLLDASKDANAEARGFDEVVHFTAQEKFEKTWPLFVPAAGTCVMTIACIVAADRINTRRAAALASAYTVSQEIFKEYKVKVLEKFGEKKEQAVRDEVAQDRVKKMPNTEIIVVGDNVLCCDLRTGRFFQSDRETIRKAENDINWQVLNQFCASLTDFYDMVGLDATDESDELGWNSDMPQFHIDYSAVLDKNNRPCLAIGFDVKPIRGFHNAY